MFGIWSKKKQIILEPNGPCFAVIQDDLVVGSFSREQRSNAIDVAGVIARATGRETQVYEIAGRTVDAEIVGKTVNPLKQGWSWVFGAQQEAKLPISAS